MKINLFPDVTTKLGEAAQLTCQIVGRPLPDIKWYRFGKELVQSRKYKMSSDGRNHTLTVITDEQEDEGLYTCMATNDVGEIETSDKTAPAEKVKLPAASPPKIKQHLKAEALGDTVKLSCAVESSVLSVREVAWYKDGKKLKENHHFKLHYAADGTYELKIHDLVESDKGEYTCERKATGNVDLSILTSSYFFCINLYNTHRGAHRCCFTSIDAC
uniref:Ig-like domain-containing protein n=1 Tax=Falco tinnunculus TaxID=100819 RepID=A0A8C4UEW6_FALTI